MIEGNNNRQNFYIGTRNLDINKERYKENKHFWKESVQKNFRSVYDNKIENWRILTNKEIYAVVKNPL